MINSKVAFLTEMGFEGKDKNRLTLKSVLIYLL